MTLFLKLCELKKSSTNVVLLWIGIEEMSDLMDDDKLIIDSNYLSRSQIMKSKYIYKST